MLGRINEEPVSSTTGLSAIPQASKRHAFLFIYYVSIPKTIAAEATCLIFHTCQREALARTDATFDGGTIDGSLRYPAGESL
jgi:hypothetical protein